jgi:hypothetical protein
MANTSGNTYRDRLVHNLLSPDASDGFPFRARVDYVPGVFNSEYPQLLPLHKGDEGKLIYHDPAYLSNVARYVREKKTIWVWVNVTRRAGKIVNLSGNVPKDYLTLGTERRYGEHVVELITDTAPNAGLSAFIAMPTVPNGDVIFRTACSLMQAIKIRTPASQDLQSGFLEQLGLPGDYSTISEIANILTNGMRNTLGMATYSKLLSGKFTWSDIKRAGTQIKSGSPGRGIYAWTHSDFIEDHKKNPAIAIGSTVSFGKRFRDHQYSFDHDLKKFNNKTLRRMPPQYDAWRRTKKHEMVAIATLDETVSTFQLEWCELLLILLFESYHPAFYSQDQTGVEIPEGLEAGRSDGDMELIDETAISSMPSLPTLTDTVAVTRATFLSADMKRVGTQLAATAETVFTTTHWPGGCISRSTFGASGRNWHSPGMSVASNEATRYTKTTVPGVMNTYRKSPQKARAHARGKGSSRAEWIVVSPILGGLVATFYKEEAAKVGIFAGTMVHVIFEIMHHGNHRYPWARLPEVPEFADEGKENIGNRLGVRLEWQFTNKNTGKVEWGKAYVQTTLRFEHLEDRPSYPYTIAIAIIRCLQLETFDKFPEWWKRISQSLYIREVSFDFLRQVLTIRERRKRKTISPPVQIPTSVRMDELIRRGAQNVGPRPRRNPGVRCDNCLMQSMDWEGDWFGQAGDPDRTKRSPRSQCQDAATGRGATPLPCFRCGNLMRLLCSFSTKNQDPRELPDALRAALVSQKAQVSLLATFEVTDDPGLQSMPFRSQAVRTSILDTPAPSAPTTSTRAIATPRRPALPSNNPTTAASSSRPTSNPHVSLPANPFGTPSSARRAQAGPFGSVPAIASSSRPAVTPAPARRPAAPAVTPRPSAPDDQFGVNFAAWFASPPLSKTTPTTVSNSRSAAPSNRPAVTPAPARIPTASSSTPAAATSTHKVDSSGLNFDDFFASLNSSTPATSSTSVAPRKTPAPVSRSAAPASGPAAASSSRPAALAVIPRSTGTTMTSDQQTIQDWDNRIRNMIAGMNARRPVGVMYQAADWLALYDVERQLRAIPSNGTLSQNRLAWLATVNGVLNEQIVPVATANEIRPLIDRLMKAASVESMQRAVVTLIRGVRSWSDLQYTSATTARRALIVVHNWFRTYTAPTPALQTAAEQFRRLLAHALQEASDEFELVLPRVVTLRSRLPTRDEVKQMIAKNNYKKETMSDISLWLDNMAFIFGQDMRAQIKLADDYVKSKK